MSARPGCRSFEDALAALHPELPRDPHGTTCPDCSALVRELREYEQLVRSLSPPAPTPVLLARLRALPTDFAARAEAAAVLSLLSPGTLLAPAPPEGLLSQLRRLPVHARARRKPAGGRAHGLLGWLFADWRVTVAVAYVATMLLVTALHVDPISLARATATDITSAGERAVAEARERFESSQWARAAVPLTGRLEYRVYRTVAVGRARASAYSQLLLEKVFGSAFVVTERSARPTPAPEPPASSIRS